MAISMFIGAPICDFLGMKRMLGLAFLCHLVGSVLTVGSYYIVPQGGDVALRANIAYWVLATSMFLVGCANGFVEIGINPLTATLYSKEKTHMLNVLHAWWPGGLFIGGLLASIIINRVMGLPDDGIALTDGAGGVKVVDHARTLFGWQIKAALVFIPTLIYGALFLFEQFPVTERVEAGVSSSTMYAQAASAHVFALGRVHADDRFGRARPTAVAELGSDQDFQYQRHVDPHVHELHDVLAPSFCRSDRASALARRACSRVRPC